MEQFLKISVWALILAALFSGILVTSSADDTVNNNATVDRNSEKVIFVTPETEEGAIISSTIQPTTEKLAKRKKVRAKYEISKRHDKGPVTFASSKEIKEDLENQPSRYRESARSPPLPVLSSTEDFTLNSPEVDDKTAPVAYETIVYDPDTKDATAAFSRSQIWDTPELVIKDSVQRQVGKNSIVESASHSEYTPQRASVQTPLNDISYRGGRQNSRYSGTTLQPFRRPFPANPTSVPTRPVYENNKVEENEEVEEDSGQQNADDENDELNEEDDEQTQKKYPVRLQEESFNPFAAVGEPEDIYSDVLSNIGSVFDDDDEPKNEGFVARNNDDGSGYKELGPEFEKHSYENLQQEDKVYDDANEELEEDNEELNEEDGDEGETKQVQNAKPVPTSSPPLQRFQQQQQQQLQQKRPQQDNRLEQSPFPSVQIIKHGQNSNQREVSSTPVPFSPWLPVQGLNNPVPTHSWQRQQGSWVRPTAAVNQQQKNSWQQNGNNQQQQKTWPQQFPNRQQQSNPRVEETKTQKQHSWPYQKPQQKKEPIKSPNDRKNSWEKGSPTEERKQSWQKSSPSESQSRQKYEPSEKQSWQKSGPSEKQSWQKSASSDKPSWQKSASSDKPSWQKSGSSDKPSWHQSNEKSTHTKSEPDKNDPGKPYHESYSKSFQKSWQSESPKKKEHNSYSKSWEDNKPVTKYQSSKLTSDASENKEIATNPGSGNFPKLKSTKKFPRQIAKDDVAVNSTAAVNAAESAVIFVTPLPADNVAADSTELKLPNPPAVLQIDGLYAKQSDSV